MSRHWFELPERGTPVALKLIRWIALHLGRGAGRALLYPITLYFLLLAPAPRRQSQAYLRRVLGAEPRWVDVFRHFHCFAATILDRVYLLAGRIDQFDVRVHDGDVILAKLQSGRGCIVISAHLGSFEVLRALGATRRGLPLKALMNKRHNRVIMRLMDELNPEMADNIIPIGGPETLLRVKEELDRGCHIGILADRVATSDKVTRCRFLGDEASFPAGPMLMAGAVKAPVVLVFGLYRGGRRYDVHFELLTDQVTLERGRRMEDVQRWTQRYAERLEHYVMSAPYNWFNFYDYWEQTPLPDGLREAV